MKLATIERPAARPVPPSMPHDGAMRTTQTLALASQLARTLGETLLASVQNTASLNLNAARVLFSHTKLPAPPTQDDAGARWRWAWRSFEVCVTTSDHMLQLARGHVDRTTAGLWNDAERWLGAFGQLPEAQPGALRDAFAALRDAQTAYWRAAQQAQQQLLASVNAAAREHCHAPH
jgi:hypothetical protein